VGLVFERQLKTLPSWQVAARLCRVIMTFAENETGPVVQADPDNPRILMASAPGALGFLFADERTGVLHALRAGRGPYY
jgi:hypothetical protein